MLFRLCFKGKLIWIFMLVYASMFHIPMQKTIDVSVNVYIGYL